jgi:hypothetical protein
VIQLAAANPDIDIIVGGHTNTFIYNGEPIHKEIPEGPYPQEVKVRELSDQKTSACEHAFDQIWPVFPAAKMLDPKTAAREHAFDQHLACFICYLFILFGTLGGRLYTKHQHSLKPVIFPQVEIFLQTAVTCRHAPCYERITS